MSRRRVAYYYDPDVGAYTFGYNQYLKPHRVKMTHDLVSAYGMLDKMHVLKPARCSAETMTSFHTDEYVQFLSRVTPETFSKLSFDGTRFLVGEDNPPFEGVFEFSAISAGGSIAASQRLNCGAADIAINWAGGLHHAKKAEASGFCYINDIVLGILELLRQVPRVLYIDIDCHHGDGVEEAFYTTDRVMTCSFHKYGAYFPGTGTQEDTGRGLGKGYSVNVPLKDGISDEAFRSVFEPVISKIMEVYRPSAVVLQCGADSLAGDKLGCFNLTMHGHARCVQFLRQQNVPLVLLGGGGYTVKNVARAWTYETACALGIEDTIDPLMPYNEYFDWFAPRFRLEVVSSNMDDLNVLDGSLDDVRQKALEQLSELAAAPSVGMHDVPRDSLGTHLYRARDRGNARDPLDMQLAQHMRYVDDLADSQDDSDSDESTDEEEQPKPARRRPRRMSIVTNEYLEAPTAKRQFFKTGIDIDKLFKVAEEKENVVLG
ncbi:histone deacetylase RPD3 [Roridomyces roridus]|uniref:Histone deacetylase n=1 Tax=Roridomyces roridus TaxID=1738132 RepID=A0AAD7C750_9AGAR|nr:histone deacetylase RPD3 [Roridomyces roridus]